LQGRRACLGPRRQTAPGRQAPGYARHRPEQTLLYRIVASHYPRLVEHLAGQGRPLPDYVQQEFEAYLKCGRLAHGFLRVRCESCHAEHLVAFSCCLELAPGCSMPLKYCR
jgi:hypothetical protein